MREALTGTRIREKRVIAGIKQADLARDIGISASYLNLIEHNKRRIGGKLLLAIARRLDVTPQALTEGAEAALVAALREAAEAAALSRDEAGRADEFASRFPGWAETLARSRRQIAALERTVDELTDRLSHDPQLAASMHELLSTAAAVRSTAAILAEDATLEPEWAARFHANINEDSRRLADSATTIVGLLEQTASHDSAALTPQEEVEAFLEAHDFRFPALEKGQGAAPALIDAAPELTSHAARYIAGGVLAQMQSDAGLLSLDALEKAVSEGPVDPAALARQFGLPVSVMLRRLAAIPALGAGLVVCDRSGTVIFRKSVDGFSVPRFGACCPLWPLFAVLGQAGLVVRDVISQQGPARMAFDAYAAADPQGPAAYNRAPMVQAVMLLLPNSREARAARPVGASCRICPRQHCVARREPSILEGYAEG